MKNSEWLIIGGVCVLMYVIIFKPQSAAGAVAMATGTPNPAAAPAPAPSPLNSTTDGPSAPVTVGTERKTIQPVITKDVYAQDANGPIHPLEFA